MNSIFDEALPIKDFDGSNIDKYILKINQTHEFHGERKCLEEKIIGQKLFKAKFINDFKFSLNEPDVFITAKERAEMKKTSYVVNIAISSNNEVLDAGCLCAGGANPSDCKHTFAVLHFINDYCMKELHSAPTEVLQQWHQPSKKVRCSPKNVDQFASPTSTSKRAKTGLNFSELSDLRYNCPLFSVLENSQFNYDEAIYFSSIMLPVNNENEDIFYVPQYLTDNDLVIYNEKIKISKDESYELERKTMSQTNDLWFNERKLRLTASNFHRIVSRRDNFDELSKNLLQPSDISHLPAVKYGKEAEELVKKKLVENFPEYKFRNVGLVINPNYPFLGASPDGLFFNETNNDYFLIEIKTVYNEKNLDLKELMHKSTFCLKEDCDGNLNLKKNHIYYHQIQAQLAITNVSHCLFVLYYGYDKDLYCEAIQKSELHWKINFPKLSDFFIQYHLKNVIEFCTK